MFKKLLCENEMQTTLNKIRYRASPMRQAPWNTLLRNLGKTQPDDEPLSLITILDILGLEDTLTCLHAVDGYDKEIRLYKVWCARQVQHLMKEERNIRALDVAEAFAHGRATKEQLSDALFSARAAERAAKAAYLAACSAASVLDSDPYNTAYDAYYAAAYASNSNNDDAYYSAALNTAKRKQEDELRRICMPKGEK